MLAGQYSGFKNNTELAKRDIFIDYINTIQLFILISSKSQCLFLMEKKKHCFLQISIATLNIDN